MPDDAKSRLSLLGLPALLLEVGGAAIYFLNIDPLIGILTLSVGLAVVTLLYAPKLRFKRLPASDGPPSKIGGAVEPRRQFVYPEKERRWASRILLVAWAFAIVMVVKFCFDDPFAFADISNAEWAPGQLVHGDDGREYRTAWSADPKSDLELSNPNSACLLTFDLRCRSRFPQIQLDQIRIVVLNYKPVPPAKIEYASTRFREAHIYLVEVDDPVKAGTSEFRAEYYLQMPNFPPGELEEKRFRGELEVLRRKYGKLDLVKDEPASFVVRVNPKTPGVYTLACEIVTSYGSAQCVRRVGKSMEWLILKPQ